jgi:hypothetical protein
MGSVAPPSARRRNYLGPRPTRWQGRRNANRANDCPCGVLAPLTIYELAQVKVPLAPLQVYARAVDPIVGQRYG